MKNPTCEDVVYVMMMKVIVVVVEWVKLQNRSKVHFDGEFLQACYQYLRRRFDETKGVLCDFDDVGCLPCFSFP